MKLNAIMQDLSHQYAKCRALSSAAAAQMSRSFIAFQQIQTAKPYAAKGNPRAAQRMNDNVDKLAQAAKLLWSVIAYTDATTLYYSEESRDPQIFTIDVDALIDFVTSSGSRPLTDSQVASRAKLAGISVSQVRAKLDAQRAKQVAEAGGYISTFKDAINALQFDSDSDTEHDFAQMDVPAARVAVWIEERLDKLLGYSSNVDASLMLLKADRTVVEREALKEEERTERGNEASRVFDDKGATTADLAAGADSN